MKIFLVNGAPGSGKTTFESLVRAKHHDTYIYSTIDFVKEVARLCGWNGTKDLRNRKFLSDLKDLLTEWNDVPLHKVESKIDWIKSEYESLHLDHDRVALFLDCREPVELDKFKKSLGAKTLLIRRATQENQETLNHADADVLKYDYDITLYNDGNLDELRDTVDRFIEQYIKSPVN